MDPLSAVIFAIYVAEIHDVEGQVEDSRGISFVDDDPWVVEGTDIDDVVSKLVRCTVGSR